MLTLNSYVLYYHNLDALVRCVSECPSIFVFSRQFLRYMGRLNDEEGLTVEQIEDKEQIKSLFWLSCFCCSHDDGRESSMETFPSCNVCFLCVVSLLSLWSLFCFLILFFPFYFNFCLSFSLSVISSNFYLSFFCQASC